MYDTVIIVNNAVINFQVAKRLDLDLNTKKKW